MRTCFQLLLLSLCLKVVLPRGTARGRSRYKEVSNDISRRKACPAVRSRRAGCSVKYECDRVCSEEVKCQTRYEYKCTDYRRQECRNVWQNQCNGKRRGRRSPRSRQPPYWLDPANTNVVDDPPPPSDQSDVPLFSPGVGGQVFDFGRQPASKSCWKKVRRCEYKVYKTTCGNKPVKECDDKPSTQCKKKCKNVYYCDKCPNKKPKPTRPTRPPVGPTRPPRPPRPTTRPPVGPPAPPPPGAFIVSPPAPPKPLDVILDVKKRRRGRIP